MRDDQRRQYDILPVSVGAAKLALKSRRHGLLRRPFLKGVWYHGVQNNGSVSTLEDVDPRRLTESYVPTGFRGHDVKARAVKGHPFGLDLSPDDRQALIAFLKTL